MARSVYITGLEPGGGKSTVALGVAELLSRPVSRLAVSSGLSVAQVRSLLGRLDLSALAERHGEGWRQGPAARKP